MGEENSRVEFESGTYWTPRVHSCDVGTGGSDRGGTSRGEIRSLRM